MQVEGDNELTGSRYYVTMCVKTGKVTKAIQWFYNAKFKTLASAENYRDSLLPLVDKINSSPPNPKAIPNIEGQRTIIITNNPAPHINYRDEMEIQAKLVNNLKNSGDIPKPEENIMPPKRSGKQQKRGNIFFFAIITVMLATALYNNEFSLEFLGVAVLLVGLIALLVGYARATIDVLKDVGIVNPLTVSIAVILLIAVLLELLK